MALRFSEKQLERLATNAVENYITELWEHCGEHYPHLNGFLGKERLRQILRDGMTKATQSGFTQRGPVWFYIDMLIMFGWGFDTDGQYPWIQEHIENHKHLSEIENADSLYFTANDYLKDIGGPQWVNEKRTAELLTTFNLEQYMVKDGDLYDQLFWLCYDRYPQKLFALGLSRSKDMLIAEHHKTSATFPNQSTSWYLVMSLLKFLYVHEVAKDPFLPFYSTSPPASDEDHPMTHRDVNAIELARMTSCIQHWGALKVYYTYQLGKQHA